MLFYRNLFRFSFKSSLDRRNDARFHILTGLHHPECFRALGKDPLGRGHQREQRRSGCLNAHLFDARNEFARLFHGHAKGQLGLSHPQFFGGSDRPRKANIAALYGNGRIGGLELLSQGIDLGRIHALDGRRRGELFGGRTRAAQRDAIVLVDARVDDLFEDALVLGNGGIRDGQEAIDGLIGHIGRVRVLHLLVDKFDEFVGQGRDIRSGIEDGIGCRAKFGQTLFQGSSKDETVRRHGRTWEGQNGRRRNDADREYASEILVLVCRLLSPRRCKIESCSRTAEKEKSRGKRDEATWFMLC
jgi:hypothetical protein